MDSNKVQFMGREMYEGEKEIVSRANDQRPFLTLRECAIIAQMHHPEKELDELLQTINKAASEERGQIVVDRREGAPLMANIESFYEWLEAYQPRARRD